MSKVKAKKKKPLNVHERKFSYEEMQEITDRKAHAKYMQMATQNAVETAIAILQLSCIILNDKCDCGKKRLKTFHDEMMIRLDDYRQGKYALDDIAEVYADLMKEYGIKDSDE